MRRSTVTEELGVPLALTVANLIGVHAMVTGRLDEAQEWLARSLETHDADSRPVQRLMTMTDRVLSATYSGSPDTGRLVEELIANIPEGPTPHGAYAWHGAGEAIMNGGSARGPAARATRPRRGRDHGGVVRHRDRGHPGGIDRRPPW